MAKIDRKNDNKLSKQMLNDAHFFEEAFTSDHGISEDKAEVTLALVNGPVVCTTSYHIVEKEALKNSRETLWESVRSVDGKSREEDSVLERGQRSLAFSRPIAYLELHITQK